MLKDTINNNQNQLEHQNPLEQIDISDNESINIKETNEKKKKKKNMKKKEMKKKMKMIKMKKKENGEKQI